MHHLWFSDEDYLSLGNKIKWNPSVKTKFDRESLRKALHDGRIDVISTDHAPHKLEEKLRPYLDAPAGGPLIQFSLPAMLDLAKENGLNRCGRFYRDCFVYKLKFLGHDPYSGFIYNESDLRNIGEVLKDYPDIIIASDDIYEHIIFNEKKFINILNVCPNLYDQTIILNGVSKAYAMTGWRIGYAAGNTEIIGAMKKIQSQSTSCTCSISQAAAAAALDQGNEEVSKMVKEYQERSEFLHFELNKIDGIQYKKPDGSFYAFVNVNDLIIKLKGINNDFDLAEYFLNEANVAVVPGTAFGSKNHIRISFATSMDNLKEAVNRINILLATT